jgi:hypothetical protein
MSYLESLMIILVMLKMPSCPSMFLCGGGAEGAQFRLNVIMRRKQLGDKKNPTEEG